jgi:hypothetical protein
LNATTSLAQGSWQNYLLYEGSWQNYLLDEEQNLSPASKTLYRSELDDNNLEKAQSLPTPVAQKSPRD